MTENTEQKSRTSKLSISGLPDVRQRKYKLSHDTTPSPTESEHGNFYRNIAFSTTSADNGSPNKRVSSINFDKDTYVTESDDVFVNPHVDKPNFSQKPKDKRIESARTPTSDENPTRKRTRKICSIVIIVILVLGLLAGIAVILLFTVFNIDKSSDVSTTTQSTVTPVPSYVVLESSVKLKNEWSNDLYNSSSSLYKTLSQNYTQEIDNLFRNSNLSKNYVRVTVLDFSPGSIIVHTDFSFMPDIFDDTMFKDIFDLADVVEDLLILDSTLQTSLLIDTSEVFVSEKCILLDFSVCSSYHDTVSFPNYYNYKSYQAAVTYFQNNLQPIVDSGCSSVSSFLLCGLNFPNCNKARQLMPCRSICEDYNKDCSSKFSSLDCSNLVDSTDPKLCLTLPVTTKTTTSSTTIESTTELTTSESTTTQPITTESTTTEPTTAESTTTQSTTTESTTTVPTTTESTTPSITTSTTATMTTTTKGLFVCEDVKADVCRNVGLTQTNFPNMYGQNNQDAALVTFNNFINDSCSPNATLFLCTMFFPKCDQGTREFPCKDLCFAAVDECGSALRLVTKEQCSSPNFLENYCVLPLPSPTLPATTTTAAPDLCEKVEYPDCQQFSNRTSYPNLFGNKNHDDAVASITAYLNITQPGCSSHALHFFCSSAFIQCDQGIPKYPCKSLCEVVVSACLPEGSIPCQFLPETNCVSMITAPTTPTTTAPMTTTPNLCDKVEYSDCQQFSNDTYYPNLFGNTNHDQAVASITAFRGIVPNNCSSHTLHFLCSSTFIQCDQGIPKYPCKSLCEVVVSECELQPSTFPCQDLPETNCVSMITTTPVPTTTTTTVPTTTLPPNCTLTGQETCPDGSCIMTEWLCDGEADCPDNWDELNCSKCSDSEFRCLDGTCINGDKRCNYHLECPDKSDERDCLHFSQAVPGVLEVAYKDYHIPLCYESWNPSLDFFVCTHLLGNENLKESSTGVVFPARTYGHYVIQADPNGYSSQLGNISPRSTCKDNKVVSLQCVPKGCGQKLVGGNMIGYIVNGYDALPGAWPWQAALELHIKDIRKHLCGGVLIAPNFVLTATHCVAEYTDKTYYRVILGATNKKTITDPAKTYEVERVIKFDNAWYSFKTGDITLLQLKEKVIYTSYIQPICLPEESEVVPTTAICYGTGWGKLTGDQKGKFSDDLQQLKLKLWNTDKCNSSKAWNGRIADGYACAGYESGVRSMCSGDSGGPLVCQDNQNNWFLKGIASYVALFCNMTNRPNVFTDVQTYVGWIKNNTECIFPCKNGKCIYDRQFLCNRVDDCGDNSDEIEMCDVAVNCTFDDPFMCGYKLQGFQQQQQVLNSQSATTLPSFDHTYGRYPGYYMSGSNPTVSEGRLTSPKFTLLYAACVRFFYNLRGDLNAGLKVYAYPYSGDNRLDRVQKWRSGEGVFSDEWRLGYFDLSSGNYEIEFVTTDNMQVSIDDVTVFDGKCSVSVCTSQEYKCTADSGRDACISHSSLCDVVKDCHSDELNCNYDQTNYFCQFENSVLCGIQQETSDNGEWLIINQTYTKSSVLFGDSFPDHSTGTDKGYMLFLLVNLLQPSKYVAMMMDVSLQQKDFCLTFWYRFKTEATFKVDIISNNTVQNLWNVTDRTTADWTKAQIQLPLVAEAVIKFTVVRQTPAVHSYYKPHLALDDFTIHSGVCPQYVCADTWTKCSNENFCYSPAERCDRKLQCSDESDEANCNCTDSEFRCNNGRCIPLSQKCDLVTQCLDGSDEGTDCESLKGVSCSFETPYLCGYNIIINGTKPNEYRWIRNRGKTPSVYTGPKADATTGTGYYMYAEGNYGDRGDKARMESVYFTSKVNESMTFYYHIYYKDIYTNSGGLEVVLKKDMSDTENIVWFNDTSTGDAWKFACFNLPANQNFSLIFIANRHPNSIQEADIAVDDIGIKDEPCHDDVHLYTVTPVTSTAAPSTTAGTGCASDQFKCNSGLCIKQTDVCDGISDCITGEDEIGCSAPP